MPFLVLPPRYTIDSIEISRAAATLGWQVERLASWNAPDWLRNEDIVLYGEPLFVSVVAPVLGVELLQPSFDWLPNSPEGYRRRAVRLVTAAEARGLTRSAFIKPVDDKCFPARVYPSGAALPPPSTVPDSELALISDPVEWSLEFRAFVLDRNVVAISPYLRDGELALGPDESWSASDEEYDSAAGFYRSILSDAEVACPRAFVMDIGMIKGAGWAIVEANPAWGSGLYDCDPEQVLMVLRAACARAGEFGPGDQRWVRR